MKAYTNGHRAGARAGFTLVELAIVLVIIGLLVGGVLVGRDLIKQAELQAVIAGMEEIKLGVTTFRLKYNALPGDMPNATQFWGAADGSTGLTGACTFEDIEFPNPTDALTCNGNGDGLIAGSSGVDTSYEKYRLWEHLKNANLISGDFTGSRSVEPYMPSLGAYPGMNVPESARNGVGYFILYLGGDNGNLYNYPRSPGHYINIGGGGWNLNWLDLAAFSPQEAAQVDRKIDDGKPGKGVMMVDKPAYTEEFGNTPDGICADGDDEETAEYRADLESLNTNARGCSVWILWRL